MPLYDYRCRACSTVTEVRHGFREAYDEACPQCGGELARVFNPAGIVFKGSGFYINDSRKAAPSESSSSSSSTATAPATPSTTSTTASSSGDSGSKKSESSAA